ncbi:MAG: 50S ribosomal protein L30 [Promethearchaeota archaeon]
MAKKKSKMKEEFTPKLYCVVRIRGAPGMRRKIEDTLKMLRLNSVNHCVLVWGEKSYMGMLNKCKDYIAYGEIDEPTLITLLNKRGKVEGNKSLTDDHIKNLTKYKGISDFAKALLSGAIQYRAKDVYKLKPVFRLHPPRKGHRGSIKRSYAAGGTLGYVGDYINSILLKMI